LLRAETEAGGNDLFLPLALFRLLLFRYLIAASQLISPASNRNPEPIMKLMRQTILYLREGTSDKVYEVDLCETGPERYVVNFRYGRRGANLKESTKTVKPVPLAAAEKIFNELVAAKTKKGYRDISSGQTSSASTRKQSTHSDADARAQAVLNRLNEAGGSGLQQVIRKLTGQEKWPLERVIWRAGELKLRAAAPALISLIGSGNALRDYCIAWSLGWLGDQSAVSALGRLYDDPSRPDFVRRIAGEALLKLMNESQRAQFQSETIARLPITLREPALNGNAERFALELNNYLTGGSHKRYEALDTIYLIDNEHVRPALLELLRTAPLRPNYFQRIRHIFKAAEYRRDAEVFGLIAYRFEKERAMYRAWYDSHYWSSQNAEMHGTTIYGKKDEIKKPDAKFAYGDQTRLYLRRRVWRTLRRLGELGDADYVKMAVGVLLPFTDADAHESKESTFYGYDRTTWRSVVKSRVRWDSFAGYFAFNHILYLNSLRYELKPGTIAWRCSGSYKPGGAEPKNREEAFPKLWEENPVGLLHLLSESSCHPVHAFAVKALMACREFCAQLDAEAIVMLLGRPYEVTAKFGFELAQSRYRSDDPDFRLALAVADCCVAEARAEAYRWIEAGREKFLADSGWLFALTTCQTGETRAFARKLLRSSVLDETVSRALIVRLIAFLLTLDSTQSATAKDITETLRQCFSPQLRGIGMNVVLDLLAHPMIEVQEFGGQILLDHETPASALPEEIIHSLIASQYETMRGIGIRLLGELPEETLLQRGGLLVALSTHELADVRQSSRLVIRKVCGGSHPEFAGQLAALFIEMLLQREPHAGVHAHLAKLLRADLGDEWLAETDQETIQRLLQVRSAAAQDFAGWLLKTKMAQDEKLADGFVTYQIARLSNHEIKSVREAAQALFISVINRFRRATNPAGCDEELMQAVHLLDSKWDDARKFYFAAFREHFTAAEFTPSVLVSICDSARADAQQFGRELITRYFAESDGQEYLLKLSEHPSADLQTFVTNYLERYAVNDPARLRGLKHYFISVLSRVNRARVAKSRVLTFLSAEAAKSEEAAQIVAEILTRQSVTLAIGDRAAAIETMAQIRRCYEAVSLPIQLKPVQVRHAV
jgi:predicted DNA-binding WGR domain protein